MTRSKNGLNIISISLPERTVQEIEDAVSSMGYTSRSELIRDAVREFLKEKVKIEEIEGNVEGVITILYNHDSGTAVSKIRHRYTGIFKSFMHSDFEIDNCSCCEVLIFSGEADDVRKAYHELKSIKGVEEASIYIASRQ